MLHKYKKMSFEDKERAIELKRRIYWEQGGRCAHCGKHLHDNYELAHVIPRKKWIIKEYGYEVINHRLNLRATCPGRCNDGVMISPESHPLEAAEIIAEIKEALNAE